MVFLLIENFFMPFHTAEQRNKERKSDSAEYPARGYKHPVKEGVRLSDVARSLRAAPLKTGHKLRAARYCGPSERLPFWFVLGKQNEHKNVGKVKKNYI